MGEDQHKPRGRRKFSPEFKRDAVDLVLKTGRPVAAVAKELGLYDSTLGNWVRQAQIDQGEREGRTERREGAAARARGGERQAAHGG